MNLPVLLECCTQCKDVQITLGLESPATTSTRPELELVSARALIHAVLQRIPGRNRINSGAANSKHTRNLLQWNLWAQRSQALVACCAVRSTLHSALEAIRAVIETLILRYICGSNASFGSHKSLVQPQLVLTTFTGEHRVSTAVSHAVQHFCAQHADGGPKRNASVVLFEEWCGGAYGPVI